MCPGRLTVPGHGQASIVPAGWQAPSGGAGSVQVVGGHELVLETGARAYLAEDCSPGTYNRSQYLALDLLGKTLRYTADVSGLGCGCTAAFYLTSMRQNPRPSSCMDHYCDASSLCGEACAEIDVQQANMHAWHSTLQGQTNTSGLAKGYSGGGVGWKGPRNWKAAQYGIGGRCVDTRQPFEVAASFPVDAHGTLLAMKVTVSQTGRACPLSVTLNNYPGVGEVSSALLAGMTPVVSYRSSAELFSLDGRGADAQGPCAEDAPDNCAGHARFYNFSLLAIESRKLRAHEHPTADPQLREQRARERAQVLWGVAQVLAKVARQLAADGHSPFALAVAVGLALVAAGAGAVALLLKFRSRAIRARHSSELLLAAGEAPPRA